jgi:hypothetical protein
MSASTHSVPSLMSVAGICCGVAAISTSAPGRMQATSLLLGTRLRDQFAGSEQLALPHTPVHDQRCRVSRLTDHMRSNGATAG